MNRPQSATLRCLLIGSLVATPCALAQGQILGMSLAQSSAQSCGQLLGASLGASSEGTSNSSKGRAATREAPDTCRTQADCPADFICYRFETSGERHCSKQATREAEPPKSAAATDDPTLRASSELIRRGAELFLRERVVQLREELALGKGPVITALAAARGESAVKLGRTLRAHRAQLVEVISDASGSDWAGEFLRRVDLLSEETPT